MYTDSSKPFNAIRQLAQLMIEGKTLQQRYVTVLCSLTAHSVWSQPYQGLAKGNSWKNGRAKQIGRRVELTCVSAAHDLGKLPVKLLL